MMSKQKMVRISEEAHGQLKVIAARTRRSLTRMMEFIINEELEKLTRGEQAPLSTSATPNEAIERLQQGDCK